MQPTAPPGWYPDPAGTPQVRWFDGVQWTSYLAPAGAPPPADLGPQNVAHWLLPVGRSWQSIVAGYVGLFSIFLFVTGPAAIAFGVWGLKLAKERNGHGRGRCIFGIVAGIWGIAVTIVLIAKSA